MKNAAGADSMRHVAGRRTDTAVPCHVATNRPDDRICQLLLITNRKSHTGFRLILTSMTLNDLERRNIALILRFFPANSIALLANYVTVVEDRPVMSVNIVSQFHLPLLAITNPPCSAVSLQ